MVINSKNAKEMVIQFGVLVNKLEVPVVTDNNVAIERVEIL
jgi:hypothetical protein